MCGRYLVATEEENIESRIIIDEINRRFFNEKVKTGDIYPTDTAPVLLDTAPASAEPLRWGIPVGKAPLINARAETLEEKPLFGRLLHTGRCLTPANAFYEWKTEGKVKTKYILKPAPFFYMAGLYGSYEVKGQGVRRCFAIITCEASGQMSFIHGRMPVLLDGDAAERWVRGYDAALLRPYDGVLSIEEAV